MRNKKSSKKLFIVLLIALIVSLSACQASDQTEVDQEAMQVMVSIVPQRYFVERIGGDSVTVSVMVEPGSSPATYEPKPEQLTSLSNAAAYFSIGVPFESAWLDKIAEANSEMMMVDTIANIERKPIEAHHHHEEEGEEDHDHAEDEHDHAEGAPDPHVWVSPELVKVQSQAIYEALSELDPQHEADYKANLEAFIADIDELEADISATLSGLKSNKFMVFHPAWGYFGDDFGLEQIAVEVGGQEPSAQELANLIQEAKEENIQVIFAQPEFSTQDAETIANEIGGEVLLISPLAPDWLHNLRDVAQTFSDVLNK